MPQMTDEAVQVFCETFYGWFNLPHTKENEKRIAKAEVKRALIAALPHLSAPCAVEVDVLANEIRRVNGSNNLGAGALAEALMPFLSCVVTKPVDVAAVREECAKAVESAILSYNLTDCAGLSDWAAFEKGQESGLKFGAAAIRALCDEPAQGEQWQPIETAPKDTTEIIVLCGQKDIRLGWYFAPSSQTFGWFDQRQKKINPTHWMRLPAAPTTEAGK